VENPLHRLPSNYRVPPLWLLQVLPRKTFDRSNGRDEELCGSVDAEVSVPELVMQGDLCPHQDFAALRQSLNPFSAGKVTTVDSPPRV